MSVHGLDFTLLKKYITYRFYTPQEWQDECSWPTDSTVQAEIKKVEAENKELFCATNATHIANLHYMNFAIDKENSI